MAVERQPSAAAPPQGPHRSTQLRFNLDVLTHPTRLAAQYTNPSPIVIEKISTPQKKHGDGSAAEDLLRNSGSSVSFSVVSEDRLNLAVQLAKQDVRWKHLRAKIEAKAPRSGVTANSPGKKMPGKERKAGSSVKPEVTRSGARVYVYTPDRSRVDVDVSDSPPTRDPGPGGSPKKGVDASEHEVRRLQKELHTYMKKIEELAKKDHHGDFLDPLEEVRGRIRQQERATRSARMLYVLQQQVKEIQADLEKLSPQKIKHTKKSHVMSRLAAVHRGAIRALQVFITQLSERGEQQIPSFYKELGYIIRQLSLCAAKLETGRDPAASNLIISILQQVEDLDVLLEAKTSSDARKPLPDKAANKTSPVVKLSRDTAVRNVRYPRPVHKQIEHRGPSQSPVNRCLVLDDPPEPMNISAPTEPQSVLQQPSSPERRSAVRSGLEALIQAGHLKGLQRSDAGQNKSKGVLIPQRPKGFRQPRKKPDPFQPSRFQKKTVSFKLKENRPVAKEKTTPWVPTNPTSPPASTKRVNWNTEPKNCTATQSKKIDQIDSSQRMEPENKDGSRLSWLESETARRLQQLDDLYREEIVRLRNLREEADASKGFPNERSASNNVPRLQLEPDIISGKDESLQERSPPNKEYPHSFQQPDGELEAVIQRIEEIEKYQDAVRQRFTRIDYSDMEFWAQEEKERSHAVTDQRPLTLHPIRITKPVGQREPVVDILLEEPFEGDSLQIHKEELARHSPHHFAQRTLDCTKGLLRLSVPSQMLQNIHDYSKNFNRHLRLTSHQQVGDFDPWHITESLAEDLINDALGEVAAELHDLCEGYAEAVFTSEFMEPTENG
ncbi:protein moonraker [Eleutherodactylus coqui]|uniref:protein moonraker n=1 Tax=Eleutherodactylus coqui TaxID=57060 RepID=UPI003461A83F